MANLGGPPWPLARTTIEAFAVDGLRLVHWKIFRQAAASRATGAPDFVARGWRSGNAAAVD
jgi:hypothetical protein